MAAGFKAPQPSQGPLQLPGQFQNVARTPLPAAKPLLEDEDDLIPAPRLERKNKLAKQAVRPKRAAFSLGKHAFNKGAPGAVSQ